MGGRLILVAGRRCILAAAQIGGVMLVIDAKNESVATWYSRYSAVPLNDTPLTLVLPLVAIEARLRRGPQSQA